MTGKTILVVDDDDKIRLLCHEVLNDEGYRVIEAEDGNEAVRKVEQESPDLVILNLQMDGVDGMETLPQLLRADRKMPVVLWTGYSRYEEDSMCWAADAFVLKSSDFGELREKVKQLLSKIF